MESLAQLDQGELEKSAETLIALKDNYKDLEVQKRALFNLACVYQNLLNNQTEGQKYFEQLKSEFPDDELTHICAFVLVNFGEDGSNAEVASQAGKSVEVDTTTSGDGLENYPNPFNPTTVIRYQIPKGGQVTLRVYDVLGRETVTLVNEVQTAGLHTAQFNGEGLASGVYFYRLAAPGINQIKKMLMVK